jgi:hypothetical protein
MGDPISIGAVGLSLASAGLGATGKILSAEGTSAADKFKAQQLMEQAQYGELKATQTNAQLTRNLNITLGNIDAVRAASHLDPRSPSGAAVRDFVESTGMEKKTIEVASIEQQARMDEDAAAYLRQASSDALLAGDIGAAGTAAGALAGAFKSGGLPGGGGGGGPGLSLTGTGGLY